MCLRRARAEPVGLLLFCCGGLAKCYRWNGEERAPSARGAVALGGDGRWAIRRGLGLQAEPFESPAQSPQGSASLRQETNEKSHLTVAFFICFLAERGGFEPPVGYEPTHAFQACDLNHSSISPACSPSAKPPIIATILGSSSPIPPPPQTGARRHESNLVILLSSRRHFWLL